jgi:hypothetical protein
MMTRTVGLFLMVGILHMLIAGCDDTRPQSPSTTQQTGKNRTYQDITLDVLAAISEKDAQKLSSLSDSLTEFYSSYNPGEGGFGGGHRGDPAKTTVQGLLNSIQWKPKFEKGRTHYKELPEGVEVFARWEDAGLAVKVTILFVRSQGGNWRISKLYLANRVERSN